VEPKPNPFIVALAVIGVVGGILALILANVANTEANSYSGDVDVAIAASVWGGLFGQVTVFAILGALVAAAVTWRPSDESSGPPRPSIDRSDLTEGEKKFFTEEDGH
jgi:H+/Cl- antiporter ClcA